MSELDHPLRRAEPGTINDLGRRFFAELASKPYILAGRLPEAPELLRQAVRRRASSTSIDEGIAATLRAIFPSITIGNRLVLANDFLKEIDQLVDRASKRCIALVDKAGLGKTSILCRIAQTTIVLAESRHVDSTAKVVRFVYDLFMEYMLARSWHEQLSNAADRAAAEARLLEEAIEAVITFTPALGALLFLDEMLDRRGLLISRALSASAPVRQHLMMVRQSALLHALEHIDPTSVTEDLLRSVDEFEAVIGEELRPRIGKVVLRLFEANPKGRAIRRTMERILEVAPGEKRTTTHLPQTAHDPDLPRLPPATYYYSEQTKLNAIGLIEMAELLAPSIVSALYETCRHSLPGIRLASYRSLSGFPELVPPTVLTGTMAADREPRLRTLAERTAKLHEPD